MTAIVTAPHRYCVTCSETLVDWDTGEGIVWIGADGERLPPPPQGEQGRREYAAHAARPHCEQGHPLAYPDAIVVGYFGSPAAGKDAMIDASRRLFAADQLGSLGVHATIDGRSLDVWRESLGRATPRATELTPYRAVAFRIDRGGKSPDRQLLVFNTSGEHWEAKDSADVRRMHTFLLELDVIVIAIPPEALPGVPDAVRRESADAEQERHFVQRGIQRLVDHLREADAPRKRTVVLALTKCDRYVDVPGFPQQALRPRRGTPTPAALADEQALLARFLLESGGTYLALAAGLGSPVFLAAVSGTGPDDLRQDGVRGAGSQNGDSSRALDPLMYALVREGVGRYA